MTNKAYSWSREPSEAGTHGGSTCSITTGMSKLCSRGFLRSPSTSSSGEVSSSPLTPRGFLDRYSLPRVVKVVAQEQAGDIPVLSGHLLLFAHYKNGKVEATLTGRRGQSTLVIPETFQGWFSVVTERGQVKARSYNSLQRIVAAQASTFLSVGDVTAYVLNTRDCARQQYSKVVLKGGQVLRLMAVYQDIGSQTAKSKRLSWPLRNRTEVTRYAQCLTSSEAAVFIPLQTTGMFYPVATSGAEDTVGKVYQLPKLLRTFPLPVRVCIISSKPQGSMLLESYRREEVILTCVLDPPDPKGGFRLLEIDVNSKFFVLRPSLGEERRLFQSERVQSALRFCAATWDRWSKQLKIIHHIMPEEPPPPQAPPKITFPDRPRKISLGDKKTVKSASFRFQGAPQPRPKPPEHIYNDVASDEEDEDNVKFSEMDAFSESGYLRVRQDVPYSAVKDAIRRTEDNVYAEIGGGYRSLRRTPRNVM